MYRNSFGSFLFQARGHLIQLNESIALILNYMLKVTFHISILGELDANDLLL